VVQVTAGPGSRERRSERARALHCRRGSTSGVRASIFGVTPSSGSRPSPILVGGAGALLPRGQDCIDVLVPTTNPDLAFGRNPVAMGGSRGVWRAPSSGHACSLVVRPWVVADWSCGTGDCDCAAWQNRAGSTPRRGIMSSTTQSLSQTPASLPSTVDRGIKSVLPADKEHLVDKAESVLAWYLYMPGSFILEYEITKAKNILKNLKDVPAYVDGKVSRPRFAAWGSEGIVPLTICVAWRRVVWQLVSSQIQKADAVAFLTNGRAGLFTTAQFGSGLVIARLPDGSWSAPSAIGYLGAGMGLQVGADITDYVLILKRQAVDFFIGERRPLRLQRSGGDSGCDPICAGNNQLVLGETSA
jgi:hypothetical protein